MEKIPTSVKTKPKDVKTAEVKTKATEPVKTAEGKPAVVVKTAVKRMKVSEKPKVVVSIKDELKAFYKKRNKDIKRYTYTPEGNLLDTSEEPAKTIQLRSFRPLTSDERKTVEEEKMVALSNATDSFVEKSAELREAYSRYKKGDKNAIGDVVRLNNEVYDTEKIRNRIAYPERYVVDIKNPDIRSVNLDKKYEMRKMGYDVYLYKQLPYSSKDLFGHYSTSEQSGGNPEDEENTITVLSTLIDNPEDDILGYLHPCFLKDFSYGGIQYAFPLQAYEATRLKGLKRDELVTEIMGTRSSRTVKNIAARDSTPAHNSFELWAAILREFYKQNTDLAKRLEETGDNLFRLLENSPATSNYLKALFSVRASLRSEQTDKKDFTDMTTNVQNQKGGGVITEKQQEKAKLGAIIYNHRR